MLGRERKSGRWERGPLAGLVCGNTLYCTLLFSVSKVWEPATTQTNRSPNSVDPSGVAGSLPVCAKHGPASDGFLSRPFVLALITCGGQQGCWGISLEP